MSSPEPSRIARTSRSGAVAVAMRGITKRFPGVLANDDVSFEVARRRGARPARRERRRQDARCRTSSPASTGRTRARSRSTARSSSFTAPREAIDGGDRDGAPALPARRHVHGRRERRPRRSRDVGAVPAQPRRVAPARSSELGGATPAGRSRREDLAALGRRAAARRDHEGAVRSERAGPDPRRADRGADAAGGATRCSVTMRTMAAEGRSVIVISHKLHEVIEVADRVTVLRGGRSIGTVDTAGATPQSLAALMVGRDIDVARRRESEARDRRRRARRRRASPRAAIAAATRSRASRSPSARARSSGSPASRATASASSRRRSPGCATSRRAPSPSRARR